MIYTVTLNPALDYYCTMETFKLGATNRCVTESLIGGGKGINVSLMLAQLGVPTTALRVYRRGIDPPAAGSGRQCGFYPLCAGTNAD